MKKTNFKHYVSTVKEFYKVVSVLNQHCGHGNWTMSGRPLRKVKRIDRHNRLAKMCAIVPWDNPPIPKLQSQSLTIIVPEDEKSVQTRLLLEKL